MYLSEILLKQFVCKRTGAPARRALNLSHSQIFDFDSVFRNVFADVYKQSLVSECANKIC